MSWFNIFKKSKPEEVETKILNKPIGLRAMIANLSDEDILNLIKKAENFGFHSHCFRLNDNGKVYTVFFHLDYELYGAAFMVDKVHIDNDLIAKEKKRVDDILKKYRAELKEKNRETQKGLL